VTISKIRFLESQGLLDPERTPSGYRKFYDADIERLRWILRQQRENFLPLKVIKDRLAAGELDEPQPANGVRAATASDAPAERDAPDAGTDAEPARAARRARSKKPAKRARSEQPSLLDIGETSVSLSLDELVNATGLTVREVGDLERFGLLASRSLGATSYYDEHALVVARLAAAFMKHGVEP